MMLREIWPLWLVDTMRLFFGVASTGAQGPVVSCAGVLRGLLPPAELDIRRGQVLQGLMLFFFLSFDLALGLGMIGRHS